MLWNQNRNQIDGIVHDSSHDTLCFWSPSPIAASSTKIGSHIESWASISLGFILAYRASFLWTTFPINHCKHTKPHRQRWLWDRELLNSDELRTQDPRPGTVTWRFTPRLCSGYDKKQEVDRRQRTNKTQKILHDL